MGIKQKQLTPFEQAEVNRLKGMKRLAGIIITMKWIERKRQLRAAKLTMNPVEEQQWNLLIMNATLQQTQHSGMDA